MTLEQINEDIYLFLNGGLPRGDPYQDFYNWLSWLGIRYNELKNCEHWTYVVDTSITIPLSKGQGSRVITSNEDNVYGIWDNILQNNYFFYVNTTTANELVRKRMTHRTKLSTGKYLGTYIFRHAYIKNKYADGMTPQQIAALMGEVNINNITGYINSVIEY